MKKLNKIRIPIKRVKGNFGFGKIRLSKKVLLISSPILLLLFFVLNLWGLALVIFIFLIAVERARKKKIASIKPPEKGEAQKLLDEVKEEEEEDMGAQIILNEINDKEVKGK